jgi:hypothetical protein
VLRVMQGNQVLYSRTFSSDIDPKEYVKNPNFTYTEGFKDGSGFLKIEIDDGNLHSSVTIVPHDPRPPWQKFLSADILSPPVKVVERPISYNDYGNPIYGDATHLSTPWHGGEVTVHQTANESALKKLKSEIKKAQQNVKEWERKLETAQKASPPNAQTIEDIEKNHLSYWRNQLQQLEAKQAELKAKIAEEKNR